MPDLTPAPELPPFTVVIPALDEGPTIGSVVAQAHLGGAAAVIVVDSGSTDDTAAAARAAGATCLAIEELGPTGPALGKGDAMWRALPSVETPVTVFIDGDLDLDGATFLPRLLAPLVEEGKLFSKASFERHNQAVVGPQPGRVTTLLARPLLALLFPELTTLIEPLSGQVAASTDLFRRLPFEVDYGVEVGMLIDIYQAFGLGAIGHPNCGTLTHSAQGDGPLAAMAEQVARTILSRSGIVPPTVDLPSLRRPAHQP